MSTTPCERCGTFAPLRTNGFRAWCDACWALPPPHPLERSLQSPLDVVVASVVVLWQHAPLLLSLQAVRLIPSIVLAHTHPHARVLHFVASAVLGTLVELISLGVIVERVLANRTGWAPVFTLVRRRYLRVLAVNVVTNLAMIAGMMMLLLPVFVIALFLNLAVPIAAFEDASPWRALIDTVKRSWQILWRLAPMSTALVFWLLAVQVAHLVLKKFGLELVGEVVLRGSEWVASPLGWTFELVAWQAWRQFSGAATPRSLP